MNVVAFKRPEVPKPPPNEVFLTISARDVPPEPGDLVAWRFSDTKRPGVFILGIYEGPTGRDGNGRWVKKGSRDEHYALDGLLYRPGQVTILGVVARGGRVQL